MEILSFIILLGEIRINKIKTLIGPVTKVVCYHVFDAVIIVVSLLHTIDLMALTSLLIADW
jgi:hypothetical protein